MDEESLILGDGTLPQQQGASSGLVAQDTGTVQGNATTLTCWQMKIPFEMPQLEVDGKVMHPLIWNLTRFHPFWALMEMTMGTSNVAFYFRRDVMCFFANCRQMAGFKPHFVRMYIQ